MLRNPPDASNWVQQGKCQLSTTVTLVAYEDQLVGAQATPWRELMGWDAIVHHQPAGGHAPQERDGCISGHDRMALCSR